MQPAFVPSDVQHFHVLQHLRHGIDRRLHIDVGDVAYAAHAECFNLGQFAWVENETLGLDPFVEFLELITRVFRGMESDDDRCLNRFGQETANPQRGHAGEHLDVDGIPHPAQPGKLPGEGLGEQVVPGHPDVDACPVDLEDFPRLEGVVDAVYNPLRTDLVLNARRRGIAAEGGLYMLAAQAAYAGALFRGCTASPAANRALRAGAC